MTSQAGAAYDTADKSGVRGTGKGCGGTAYGAIAAATYDTADKSGG
jgi:hypothetical protein